MRNSTTLLIGRGRQVAAFLAGAWRTTPPPLELAPSAWPWLADFLLKTGAGALGWWRLRASDLAGTQFAEELRQAYRLHAMQTVLHERNLQRVLGHLFRAGIEPLVIKGWTASRLYPDPALRPYGDIDLAVAPGQLAAAEASLFQLQGAGGPIDLHDGMPDLGDQGWSLLWARSRQLDLGTTAVRVLGPEDQLRHLSLHLLRHGAWRPLWLCDVGAALEAAGPEFDWDYCLGGDHFGSEWVVAAVGLAMGLLGARGPSQARSVPAWLTRAVLRQWGAAWGGDSHTCDDRPILTYVTRPAGLWRALRARWPNPIEAALALRSRPHGRTPTWCLQMGVVMRRVGRLAVRLPRQEPPASAVTVHSS